MSNLYWRSDAQMERLKPFFPTRHGKPRVDDRCILSGIIFINHNGLRWCDAPKKYGPPKTLYNRWKCWSDNGVFARIMVGLAAERAVDKPIMIDVSRRTPCVRVRLRKYLKAHRTASRLRVKKGACAPDRANQRRHEHQTACCFQRQGAADRVLHVGGSGQ